MTAPALKVYIDGTTNDPVTGDNLNTFEQTCDLASQLRAFIGTAGSQVFIRGLTAVGDGGQGVFYWVGTGALVDNGVTVIVPPGTAAGGWLRATYGDALQTVRVVTAAGGVTVSPSDGLIVIRKTVAATTTVTLPTTPALGETHGIKDGSGNATAYNITVSAGGTNLIDGATTYVMPTNYQETWLTWDGSRWNIGPAYNSPPLLTFLYITASPSISFAPTTNPPTTLGTVVVQAATASTTTREFLVSIGLSIGTGSTAAGANRDKVALFVGADVVAGAGDAWAINPVITMESGSGTGNVQGIELDFNNLNADRGNAVAGAGLSAPIAVGFSITGASVFLSTSAMLISGPGTAIWNRGITIANNSVSQSSFQDLGSSAISLDIYGSHTYGLDTRNGAFSGGPVRIGNSVFMVARNAADSADLPLLGIDSANNVIIGGAGVAGNFIYASLFPATDNTYSLGGPANRYTVVYATTGTINTSAEHYKKSIAPLPDGMIDVMLGVRMRQYQWIDGGGHPGKRIHFGVLAGDIKTGVSDKLGIDFAGYVKNDDDTWEGLRMDQLTPILWKAQQELVTEMRGEVAALKQQVAALAAGAKP